ncbi:MAG: HAD family phosphatase [Ruminococcus sp.]|nr:HAD family phosphatase [Ruminococcus sp.]
MLKAVIFDMDGLLVDTEKLLQRFWVEAAQFYGYPMKKEHVLQIRSLSGKLAAPLLQKLVCDDFDYAKVRLKRLELMNAFIAENGIEKKKGIDELLGFLDTTPLKKAVCTATDDKRTKLYLESIGIYHRFDEHISGNMIANGKPAPDIYLYACERLGLAPNECMAFEDSPNGISSAYDAGCMTVMIPDLSQPDEQTRAKTAAVCESLDRAIDVIKEYL